MTPIPPTTRAKRTAFKKSLFPEKPIRTRLAVWLMRSPLERFPTLEFVQRRAAVRYSFRRGNPRVRKTEAVPRKVCENWLHREKVDGPECEQHVSAIRRRDSATR